MERVRSKILLSLVFVFLVVVDQITKWLAYNTSFGDFFNYFKPVFGKLIFPNHNFAFSLKVPVVLMYVIYFVLLVLLALIYRRSQNKNFRLRLALVLIFAGAVGNIFDRILLGYVRDFIWVFWGNIFNLADLYILAGLLMLLFRKD